VLTNPTSARRPRVASHPDALAGSLIIVAAVITIAVLSFFGLYVTALAGVKIPSLTSSSVGGTTTPPAGH
jgi:hypothetical protein